MKHESSEKLWFVFSNQKLLLTQQLEILTKSHAFLRECKFTRKFNLTFNDSSHSIAEINPDILLPEDLQLKSLRELYHVLPPDLMALTGKAFQLLEWDQTHQFCGACGSPTQTSDHEHCKICLNASCKRLYYPKISPVIMVAIERGPEILLARSPHFPPDIYSVLAGFVEPGETIEEAVHREVFEEIGLKIKNLRYFGSQPWPFPNSLIFGFQAAYDSGEIICAPDEIEDAGFFHVANLPKVFPGNASISKWLLNDFCNRMKVNK